MAIIKPNNNTLSAVTALPFGTGITEADQFRLTTDFGSNGDITANLERTDDASFEKNWNWYVIKFWYLYFSLNWTLSDNKSINFFDYW